jgi:hypothetical protein
MGTYVCEGKREKKRRNEPESDLCFVFLHAWGILSKHVWVCKGKAAVPVKPDVAKSRDGDRPRRLWVRCLKAGHARYVHASKEGRSVGAGGCEGQLYVGGAATKVRTGAG